MTATVDGATVTLRSDKPAFYVMATTMAAGEFDDNSLVLLPDRPRTLTLRDLHGAAVPAGAVSLMHLRHTY